MDYFALFSNPPDHWGLRGDPFLWETIGRRLCERERSLKPASSAEDVLDRVRDEFLEVTGGSMLDGDSISVPGAPLSGMSGGQSSRKHWRDHLMPQLHRRADTLLKAEPDPAPAYHPATHKFRFAAWCASTAARSSRMCRFDVETGVKLLNSSSSLWGMAFGSHWLPQPHEFDKAHSQWCRELMRAAEGADIEVKGVLSFGVAAKLTNIYLKALFISQMTGERGEDQAAVDAIHPPLDRLLLSRLASDDVGGFGTEWRKLRNHGWSKFDEGSYLDAISLMRRAINEPLWTVERYWRGYQ